MRVLTLPVALLLIFSSDSHLLAQDSYQYQLTMEKLAAASTEQARFYTLREAAKGSFLSAHFEEAKNLSLELLALAPKFAKDWNYGNAIHDGNMVLGRIALRESKIDEAKAFLKAAGKTPGSPQLGSFGPNMSLAKDLLEIGERAAVLEYFSLCSKFWGFHQDYLDRWSLEVRNGQIPDFKGNLVY